MATTKVSALTALTTSDGAEELLINDGGTSKKITIANATANKLPLAGGTMTGQLNFNGTNGLTFKKDDTGTPTANTTNVIQINRGTTNTDAFISWVEGATDYWNIGSGNNSNQRLQLGTIAGTALVLDHNSGTDSSITSGGCDLEIRATGSGSEIKLLNTTDVTGNITVSGTVDGRDVAADGVLATNALPKAGGTMTGTTAHGDNIKATYGTGADLQIYHDGNHSYIQDSGDGDLRLKGNNIALRSNDDGDNYIYCAEEGAVTLYYHDAGKLATTNTGIAVTGDIANASGDMVLDVAGALVLDANDSGYVTLKDNGTAFGEFNKATNDFVISSKISDGDIVFKGNDNSQVITAMTIDMSAGGNLGIGDTTPESKLKVYSNALTSLKLEMDGVGAPVAQFYSRSGSFNNTVLQLYSDRTSSSDYNFLNVKGDVDGTEFTAFQIRGDGNVGIGTASPNSNLHLYNNGDHVRLKVECAQSSGQAWMFQSRNNGEFWIRNDSGSGTNALIINSSGNVGIEVTPQITNPSFTSLQVGGTANITTGTAASASQEMDIRTNSYYAADGNNKYIVTDEAAMYRQGGGEHSWHTAASGSAGANQTFSESMRINSSRNILKGYTATIAQEVCQSGTTVSTWTPDVQISNSGNGGLAVSQFNTGNTASASLWLTKSSSNTIGTQAALASGEAIGRIIFSASDASTFSNAASIEAFADEGQGTNDTPGRLEFKTTADGATTPTTRMTIKHDGEVLIGTTAQGRETNLAVVGSNQLPTGAWSQFGIYSNDSYAINKGGSMLFGGQDGSTARQFFSAIKGAKENATSGNYAGYLAFYTRPAGAVPAERMNIDSAGVVNFHGRRGRVTSSTGGLSISSQSDSRSFIEMGSLHTGTSYLVKMLNNNGEVGSITTNGSATAFNTSSDYRLKENVDYTWDATTRLKQLKPARFNFIADADKTVDGFLAHEAQTVVPECVTGTKDAMTDEVLYVEGDELPEGKVVGDVKKASVPDMQGIDQSKLVPLLVKTIQELEARITALEA